MPMSGEWIGSEQLLMKICLKRPKGNNMYHMKLSSLHKAQLPCKYMFNNRNGKKDKSIAVVYRFCIICSREMFAFVNGKSVILSYNVKHFVYIINHLIVINGRTK